MGDETQGSRPSVFSTLQLEQWIEMLSKTSEEEEIDSDGCEGIEIEDGEGEKLEVFEIGRVLLQYI